MKVKTSELQGAALDWAVAIAEGFKPKQLRYEKWSGSLFTYTFDDDGNVDGYITGPDRLYSRKWEAGGPIIEREEICISKAVVWCAVKYYIEDVREPTCGYGPTLLIAAMRCYCCAKLGDEIDIPEELCQQRNS